MNELFIYKKVKSKQEQFLHRCILYCETTFWIDEYEYYDDGNDKSQTRYTFQYYKLSKLTTRSNRPPTISTVKEIIISSILYVSIGPILGISYPVWKVMIGYLP